MPIPVKEMLVAANAVVDRINTAQARDLLQKRGLLLDIRDAPELERTGPAVVSVTFPEVCWNSGLIPIRKLTIRSFAKIAQISCIVHQADVQHLPASF